MIDHNESENYLIKTNGSLDADYSLAQTAQLEHDQEQDNEILRYVHMILDRKWLVLACVLVLVVVAAIQLRKATPIYIAKSTVKYEPNSLRLLDMGEIGRPINAIDEIKTQVEIIRGPKITSAVINALGMEEQGEETSSEPQSLTPLEKAQSLWRKTRSSIREVLVPPKRWEFNYDELRKQGVIARMRDKVGVYQREDTKLIDIVVRDAQPMRAARIANEYAFQYQESINESKQESYLDAREFFDTEVAEAKSGLEGAKTDLLQYSRESATDLQMMEQEAEISLNMTKQLRQQIEELETEVALQDVALSDVDSNAVRAHLLSQDAEYNNIVKQLNELRLEEVTVAAGKKEDHPEVQTLKLQIETLEKQLQEHEDRFRLESMGQALLAKNELAALKNRLKQQEQKFNDLQSKMIQYSALKMDVESQQQMYEQLLSRFKEINVASEVKPDNVTIHALSEIPTVPAEPRVFNSLMLHAIMGFLFGCFLAVGFGWFDRSVSDPVQVQNTIGLAPLGVIPFMGGKFKLPFVKRRKRATVRLINTFDPYSTQAESFRLLRTNLQYSTAGKTPEILMVTSCLPSEGKSTISANMAISFASLGEKVLLIDADLKLPNLHRQFGLSKRPGLSDVLTGQETVESVVVETGVENLQMMPAGPQSPSPVELLESSDMTDLLESLRPKYDRIILDTAPLHGMSDSFVIANKVDGLCLVASIGRTRLDILKRTVQSLQNMKVRVLGMIFNYQFGGSRSMPMYYYYKSGGYGYGYSDSRRGRYDRLARRDSEENIEVAKK